MEHPAARVARDLAAQVERACRTYLSNGRREGNYWLVGDVTNTPGRSLYVRLRDSPDGGRRGKWTDAQSGEHGDLLDIVRAATPYRTLAEALTEARRFLSLPEEPSRRKAANAGQPGSAGAARRLFSLCVPIIGTTAENYLATRHIPALPGTEALRFHPRCWYRRSVEDHGPLPSAMPALVAAVTDLSGVIVGAHRTWLAPGGVSKARVATPRRAMGNLLGNGVRFGAAAAVMAAAEGIESTLSLRLAVPTLPAIAALSAAHLGALAFPRPLRRLYVAREEDAAGTHAFARLTRRCAMAGIELLPLLSEHGDLNADLCRLGRAALASRLQDQMLTPDLPAIA